MAIKINRGIPYKMDGPNPAKFSNCILRLIYMIVILCVNHVFSCSYNMARCRQAPYKMASEMGLEALQISTCDKMAGLLKVNSYKITLAVGLIWGLRPAI